MMEIRGRVGSTVRAAALLVVSITITATILAAMLIETLAPTSLSASAPLRCTKTVYPELLTLEFIEDCRTGSRSR
jgi:hypothetical protein